MLRARRGRCRCDLQCAPMLRTAVRARRCQFARRWRGALPWPRLAPQARQSVGSAACVLRSADRRRPGRRKWRGIDHGIAGLSAMLRPSTPASMAVPFETRVRAVDVGGAFSPLRPCNLVLLPMFQCAAVGYPAESVGLSRLPIVTLGGRITRPPTLQLYRVPSGPIQPRRNIGAG